MSPVAHRGDVGQPDDILADAVARYQAKGRAGAGEKGCALTKYDRMHIDPILVNQAKRQ